MGYLSEVIGSQQSLSETEVSSRTVLFGTLDIEGRGSYYVFLVQTRTYSLWILTERTVFDTDISTGRPRGATDIVAIVKTVVSGKVEGYGETYLITRLLDSLSTIAGRASKDGDGQFGYVNSWSYRNESNSDMIIFKTFLKTSRYSAIDMVYEGFRLSLDKYSSSLPFKVPQLQPVVDDKLQVAMIAGLGVRTFSLLKARMGNALDWYDHKDYRLIQSDIEFRQMMLNYLRSVQKEASKNRRVLTALDTETTGLNMYDLSPNNPYRDHIVAIPFGWEDDKAYVVCMDMYYFKNVSESEVYPLFHQLFSVNPDYSKQDIELDYCGEHFKFNRANIMLVGANVDFDIRAFLSHDCDIFFDEDIQKINYNLATDLSQGRNSLKWMTHHYIGDETLELEDLFGPSHKDKYRYLSDSELALVYGGADADYPRKLWFKLRSLFPNNLYNQYRKYDMTAVYQTSKATWRGMPIDDKTVKEQGSKILQDIETLKDFIYSYAYAANRNNLSAKSKELCDLLGMSPDELGTSSGSESGMYRYRFTPANNKQLVFNVLDYPVIKRSAKSNEPALDKYVWKKLASYKRETPLEFLTRDIMSVANPGTPLISKDEFNKSKYPLALVFLKYSELNKEYTAYYGPIMQNDLEGRMFYTFSLQRAATRRILSPGQTMKGSLKKLVIAPPKKLFMCFDASQIEYRHMASLAYIQTKNLLKKEFPEDWEQRLADSGISRIHSLMYNEEADYHIETASMMTGLPQYQIDHETRRMYKSIGFGIPYGLGDSSMCEALFGKSTPENMAKTREVLADYKSRQFEIIRMLETARDEAFRPAKISDEFRELLGVGDSHVGIVKNFMGFYRLFVLDKVGTDRARVSRIRRQAGNCVIQGGAAELFRRMIYNFHAGCVEAGYDKKVDLLMLVHDEVDCLIDDDVDICKVIDFTSSGCTLRYEDHIPYYIGIGFGHDWEDAKGDGAELPVIMVNRMNEAYRAGKFSIPSDGNQPENLLKLKRHYLCDRVYELLHEIVPELGPGFVWSDRAVDLVDQQFSNYTVRAYLSVFCSKSDKEKYGSNVPLKVQLESWQKAREEYGFGKDFLSVKLKDAREELHGLSLDLSDDDMLDLTLDDVGLDTSSDSLTIDLLDNESEEQILNDNDSGWFGEEVLFDPTIPTDEIFGNDNSEGYVYSRDEEEQEEEEYEVNESPTSAFDVYVCKHYVRKHIFSSSPGVYTIMLNGTEYYKEPKIVARVIRSTFSEGTDTILVIGTDIFKIKDVSCTSDLLDRLDQKLCG